MSVQRVGVAIIVALVLASAGTVVTGAAPGPVPFVPAPSVQPPSAVLPAPVYCLCFQFHFDAKFCQCFLKFLKCILNCFPC